MDQVRSSTARAALLWQLLHNGKTAAWKSGSEVESFYRHVAGMFDAGYAPRGDDDAGEMTHYYLSTGCLHGEHEYCQSMVGTRGEKRPGRCKFCDARCVCECHATA